MSPMNQMIHQVKFHQKNDPIWMAHHHDEGLRITADNGEKCFVDQKYVPRGRWFDRNKTKTPEVKAFIDKHDDSGLIVKSSTNTPFDVEWGVGLSTEIVYYDEIW